MNAELMGRPRIGYTLPNDAIIHLGNKSYVFVTRGNNTFEKWEVKTGVVGKQQTEISLLNSEEKLSDISFVYAGAYTLWMKLNNIADED
jgi:hypothetical protein